MRHAGNRALATIPAPGRGRAGRKSAAAVCRAALARAEALAAGDGSAYGGLLTAADVAELARRRALYPRPITPTEDAR